MDKTRITATERDEMMRVKIAHDILTFETKGLAKRIAGIPGGKRDLALIIKLADKLMQNVLETIPDEQRQVYSRALHDASYTIGVRCRATAANKEKINMEYGFWTPLEVLNALIEGCHDRCATCNLDFVGRKKCRLKRALDILPNDTRDKDDGDCPYYFVM